MKKKCISDKTGVFTNQKEIILWIMKKSFYFFVVFFNISVFGYTQNLSLNLGKVSLYESFKKIEEESNITLFYSDTDLDVDKLVTVKFRNKKPLDIVANLVGSDYTVKLIDNSILVISPNPKEINVVEQQTLVDINGIVKDENGIPLAGVNIIVKGDMNFSFQTDFDGTTVEKATLAVRFDAYDGDVLVLPDFNHEQVLLQFSESNKTPVSIMLMDAAGRLMLETICSDSNTCRLQTSRLSRGVYVLRMQTTEGVIVKRFFY